jgi:hypothetical protein
LCGEGCGPECGEVGEVGVCLTCLWRTDIGGAFASLASEAVVGSRSVYEPEAYTQDSRYIS